MKSLDQMDFDERAALAAADPDYFEALRADAVDELIDHAPADKRARLRRLQWRIDQERRLATNPVSACVRLNRMMWETLAGEGGLLENMERLSQPPGEEGEPRRLKGEVVEFRGRKVH